MGRTAHVEIEDGPHLLCVIPDGVAVHVDDQCILRCDGVEECGHVTDISDEPVPREGDRELPAVLRMCTLQDRARAKETALRGKMALDTVAKLAAEKHIPLRIVRGRYSFDHHLLSILFTADDTVDVRSLGRELAHELHARVNLQQIGVRDEAGIIGGMGLCGRRLCCCTWLHDFASVNVKMAKTQKLSLNPIAISGNCGRLKCCLRYEYEQYRDLSRGLPRYGATVDTPQGSGRIIATNILLQRVRVRHDDERIAEFDVDDIRPMQEHDRRRDDHENPGA